MRKFLLFCISLSIIAWIFLPKPPLMDTIGFSQAFFDDEEHLLRLTLSPDEKYRQFVPLNSISSRLIEATLLKEDRFFYWHLGVNPFALIRALFSTYITHDKKLGASTITMQLARLRYNLRTRSITGKLNQILMALELERHYSKKEILNAYLNLAPYGRNVEGVGAASLVYFHKKASDLNLSEILTLVSIPQSPQSRAPDKKNGADNALMKARSDLYNLWKKNHPTENTQTFFIQTPISTEAPETLPYLAPHFINSLLQNKNLKTSSQEINTTLNLSLQKILERHVQSYIEKNKKIGLHNASALLLDYRTMFVKAAVGSVDFFSQEINGQVNGIKAKRSPGSALKPFVYALAIDQGLIHPMTLLKDTASSFGGYDPENFDHEFLGPISAHDALIKSRNIPAVALASQLRDPTLYEFYQSAEISKLREPQFYGLSTALGGFEITMEEMVRLYAMLANGGINKEIISVKNNTSNTTSARLLSSEASYLTLDILKDNPPPDLFLHTEASNKFPVYWKTGTSFSYRDAWSVGIFGPYVLAVWIGNFDGEGNNAFVGRSAAAPLFFEIIQDIKPSGKSALSLMSERYESLNIKHVEVCPLSGGLIGNACPHKTQTLFIPGKSPISTCEIHRRIAINKNGLRACLENEPNTQKAVYEFWPSDLLALFKKAGFPRLEPPPYERSCHQENTANTGRAPQIVSPKTDVIYSMRLDEKSHNQIPLKAILDQDTQSIFWFANDVPIGNSTNNQTVFWEAKPGHYMIRAVDGNGRDSKKELDVTTAR